MVIINYLDVEQVINDSDLLDNMTKETLKIYIQQKCYVVDTDSQLDMINKISSINPDEICKQISKDNLNTWCEQMQTELLLRV